MDDDSLKSVMRRKPSGIRPLPFITAAVLMLLIAAGCSSDFDRKKFDKVNGAALAVRDAFESSANYRRAGETIETFSREVSVLRNSARPGREKELLTDYSFLLAIYRDGYVLWRCRNESERYGFIPRGMIYVWQDVDPIIEKYRIPTESHIYGPTRTQWRSIPADSVGKVLASADTELKVISGLLDE